MREICFACGKKIGFFDTANAILDENHGLCANCWGKIGAPIVRFKHSVSEKYDHDEITSRYEESVERLNGVDFADDVKNALLEELSKVYEDYSFHYVSPEEQEKQVYEEEQQEIAKQRAMASMLITSGFTFDGYKIVKYSGYISGDDAVQVDRGTAFLGMGTADAGQGLTDSLVRIRRQALKELKEAAYDLGCNAVIGVDFDYITLEPETASISGKTTYLPYVFCVTANGNAVIIEKDDSDRSLVSTMKEYKELLDAGIITQDEYERKRAQILDL